MAPFTIDTYQEAEAALRRSDLRQALYDEGAILMKKVLVNLHGDEHLLRKRIVTKILRPAFFHHYERSVFRPTLTQTRAPYVAAGKADIPREIPGTAKMKSALITGAGSGIGAVLAARAARSGYKVGVLDIDEAKARAGASKLDGAVARRPT